MGEEFTSQEVLDCWNRTKIYENDKRRKLKPTERECCKIVSGIQDIVKFRERGKACNVYYKEKDFKYDEKDILEIIHGNDSTILKRA